MNLSPICPRVVGAFLALGAVATPVMAKDLHRIGALVAPAYTAMFIANMCAVDDPQFIVRNTGPRGTALHFAQHVKDEAIEGLTHDEAVAVLTEAATAARDSARATLHRIADPFDKPRTVQAVRTYCDGDGRAMILLNMQAHDASHDRFLDDLRAAKTP